VFVVDTNLLLYAADEDSPAQQRMRRLLAEWGSSTEPWLTVWSVIYEFLRVATHRSVFSHPLTFAEAWSFIESLRSSPSFGVLVETERHAEVVRDLTREYPRMSGNRLHDLHIAAVMREHGVVEIRTADAAFHEFKFLRVINPL
jgi:uncharacterized protein